MKLTFGNIILLFFVFGLFGSLLESALYSLGCSTLGQEKRWTLNAIRNPTGAPFKYKGSINPLATIPSSVINGLVYGLGTIILILANTYMGNTPLVAKIFIFGTIATILEVVAGLIANRKYDQWDYRGNFLNIKGQTDFKHWVAWCVLGSVLVFLLIPKMEPSINKYGSIIGDHKYLAIVFSLVAACLMYYTEKSYTKGNEPLIIKLYGYMEPDFPSKRKCSPISVHAKDVMSELTYDALSSIN